MILELNGMLTCATPDKFFALDCYSMLGTDQSSVNYMKVLHDCEIKCSYNYMFDSQVLGVLDLQQKGVT